MAEEKKRTIKLFCPSLSKLVAMVAWEEQKLDLGYMTRTFGIEPATLKLNGHLISRGVDLVASSVTWKSLLSFFSARGFSTGASDSDALIVDGKLSKLGSKRGADCPVDNETTHPESTNSPSTKRIKEGITGTFDCMNRNSQFNNLCLKRKLGLEESSPGKKTRTNESDLDLTQRDAILTTTQNRLLPCSLLVFSHETKRMREEDMVIASPLKRIRN